MVAMVVLSVHTSFLAQYTTSVDSSLRSRSQLPTRIFLSYYQENLPNARAQSSGSVSSSLSGSLEALHLADQNLAVLVPQQC